ncbi:hypothetical protein AB4302_18725, partial [Vibrio breoganii]
HRARRRPQYYTNKISNYVKNADTPKDNMARKVRSQGNVTLNSDNGAPVRSSKILAKMHDLGVVSSYCDYSPPSIGRCFLFR